MPNNYSNMNNYGGGNTNFGATPQNQQFMNMMGVNQQQNQQPGALDILGFDTSNPVNQSNDQSAGNFWTGGTDANGNQFGGAAMPAIQLGTGLLQGYLGMKQYGLAKDQFRESKRQFQKNYDNQVQTTNTQLRDRQRARRAANPGAHQSVDEYMKENRVGG